MDVRMVTRAGSITVAVSRSELLAGHAAALSEDALTQRLVDAAFDAADADHDGSVSFDEFVAWAGSGANGSGGGGIVSDLLGVFSF